MGKILKKLNVLLDRKQKRIMLLLVFATLIGAILETLGISLIIPAVTVLMDSTTVQTSWYMAPIYQSLHFQNATQFTVAVLLALLMVFIFKNLFLFLQNKMIFQFVYSNQFATSRRMMINFMKRPYEYYLNADTAVIQRTITSDVNNMYGLILSLLQLVSEGIIFAGLVTFCLFTGDLFLSLTMAVLLILVLLVIKIILKPIMKKAGKENQEFYSGLFKWIDQSVTGIKEIKIANKENYFINEYAKCGAGYVNAVQKYNLYNATPRLLIEVVAMAGLILYIVLQVQNGTPKESLLTAVTALGVIAMRLIPCANRINNHLTAIAYFEPFFMGVNDNLQEDISDGTVVYDEMVYRRKQQVDKLKVDEKISLQNITYQYPNTEVLIFDHANMEIPVGSAVGIVGTSGSGKTTVVDIMLGLLRLETGKILADGIDVAEHYGSWLKNIGYIPQTIFMIDDTIRKNVAFGIAEEEIDEEKVWRALREAQLDDFVRGLPEGLHTGIGERGIRISGGQRQRIGIARALYEDPEVLVLDEATSALDNETERAIMESVNRLHGRKTLIIIAHRLQTIEKCDMVYRIENGKATRER